MIKSVQKAVQILQILSDNQNDPLSLGEIAARAELNKSTCAHLLETLCECGMAERISRQEGYRVGMLAYYVTRHGRYNQELVEICNPLMHWLNKKTGHSVVLAVLRSHKKTIIHWVNGINMLPSNYGNLYYEEQYRFSTSHAILAGMTEMERSEYYRENGFPSQDEWPKLYEPEGEQAAYEEINRRGYELFRCPEPHEPNAIRIGMAAAIRKKGKTVAALGIALPNECGMWYRVDERICFKHDYVAEEQNENVIPWHLTDAEEAFIARHLLAAVKEINRRMEF